MYGSVRGTRGNSRPYRDGRREFITLFGGTALACPLAVRAQEHGRTYRLAIATTAGRDEPATAAFLDELRIQGFVEGKNLEFVPGGFRNDNEQAGAVVPAIVNAAPDAIVSAGDFITEKFQKATKSIPLIAMTEDMVAAGFAASLARPGGNITGISLMSPELDGKRQDILIEAVPGLRRSRYSRIPMSRHCSTFKRWKNSVRTDGAELLVVALQMPTDPVPAMNDETTRGATARRAVLADVAPYRRIIIERAAEPRLPAIYQ